MQITVRPSEILSRLAALLLVAIPLAAFAQWMGEVERQEVARMSHEELKKYLMDGYEPGFAPNFGRVAALTAVYLLVVETVAFVIRLGVRAVSPDAGAAGCGRG